MASQNNLFDALKENLQRSGKLSKLKAQLRSDIIKILEPMSNTSPEPEIPSECAIINELIREYLSWHGYKYTECVFSAEIKLPTEPLDRVSLIRSIGVVETERTSKLPLLYSIVSTFKEMVQRP